MQWNNKWDIWMSNAISQWDMWIAHNLIMYDVDITWHQIMICGHPCYLIMIHDYAIMGLCAICIIHVIYMYFHVTFNLRLIMKLLESLHTDFLHVMWTIVTPIYLSWSSSHVAFLHVKSGNNCSITVHRTCNISWYSAFLKRAHNSAMKERNFHQGAMTGKLFLYFQSLVDSYHMCLTHWGLVTSDGDRDLGLH